MDPFCPLIIVPRGPRIELHMNLRKAREEEINMRRRAGLVVCRTMTGLAMGSYRRGEC